MRSSARRRSNLKLPEPIDVTIDRARGPDAPWAKPAVRERVWRDAVGGRIADRARPVEISHGTLWVRVATSVWANELSLLHDQLVQRLRERGVSVHRLRFKVGPIDPHGSPAEPRRNRTVRPSVTLPRELEAAIGRIDDDELREGIAGAARANLAWQEDHLPTRLPRKR
jgi:hypothetical protein